MLHSGAAARIRPAESVHRGQQGLVRTDRSDSKVTNPRKNPQDLSQQNRNIFQHRTIHRTKRGGKKQDCPTITTNKGTFLHLLPHSARRRVIQFVRTPLRLAHTPARVYAHSAVFRLLPSPFTTSPYFSQYVTIRGEGFAFVRSSASSPEKSNRLIDFSAAKPLRFGGSTGVNFCIFPSSPESSPVSH